MRKRHGGIIVNLSSVQGHACQSGVSAYVTSKGAIHALTRAMALDFAPDRIRVVSISPDTVRTPILELAARTFEGEDADIESVFERFGAAHPLGHRRAGRGSSARGVSRIRQGRVHHRFRSPD
jgi:NAD(P)-dependent dehydrogenase (short-subunit alcohol dehydrogenase family)